MASPLVAGMVEFIRATHDLSHILLLVAIE